MNNIAKAPKDNCKSSNIECVYSRVCTLPHGAGFQIEYLPKMLIEDTFDHSSAHVHDFYEILWFQSEGGKHTVDFHEYGVHENMIFFLTPGETHFFDGKTQHKGVIIKLCTDFLRDEGDEADMFLKYNVLNAFDQSPYFTISPDGASRLKDIFRHMEEEQQMSDGMVHAEMLRTLTKLFMLTAQRYGTRENISQLSLSNRHHYTYVEFKKNVENQFRSLHTVKEYADLQNVSTKTLTQCVTECSGKSPLTIINERIVLEAKRLLRFTDMMIKEIAFMLGYDDPSYFVKYFKRQTGYLPADFRAQSNG